MWTNSGEGLRSRCRPTSGQTDRQQTDKNECEKEENKINAAAKRSKYGTVPVEVLSSLRSKLLRPKNADRMSSSDILACILLAAGPVDSHLLSSPPSLR
jgi:hypothetical protein